MYWTIHTRIFRILICTVMLSARISGEYTPFRPPFAIPLLYDSTYFLTNTVYLSVMNVQKPTHAAVIICLRSE